MLDKRCKYRYKERHQFYLYIKYPQSHIYYAKFPEFGYKSISTGKTNLREAYIKGCEIYKYLFYNTTFDWGIEDKFILERLPKTPDKLTVEIIQKIQNELLETGISGKTVNNRMGVLHKYIAFPPVAHKKVIRKCYPIEKLYGLGSQYTLAFIAITTGMRKGEFDNCEAITDNGKLYLQINGTKTDNSVRKVPIIPETVKALEDYKKRKWTDRDFRKSVDEVGELIGIDPYKDNIVFTVSENVIKRL